MEKSLRDKLLDGDISDPFDRSFSWEMWERHLQSFERSADDERLYAAAKYIVNAKEALFNALGNTIYFKTDKWQLIELFVAFANSIAVHVAKALKEDATRKPLLGRSPRITSDTGTSYTTDDMHTNLIDGLRFPLEFLLSRTSLSERSKEGASVATIQAIPGIVELANAWDALKNSWQRCLRYGYEAEQTGQTVRLATQRDDAAYFTVGRSRHTQRTVTEYAGSRHIIGRDGKPMRARMLSRKGYHVQLARDRPHEISVYGVDNFTRTAILHTDLILGLDVAVEQLFFAWEFLGDLAGSAIDRLANDIGTEQEKLLDQTGRFSIKSVISTMAASLEISEDEATQLFALLSYTGRGAFDPWVTPIVVLDDGTCALLLGVLCYADRSFVLESSMSAYGYDMDARGPAFEEFLYEQTVEAVEKCRFSSLVFVAGPCIILRDPVDGAAEEIDVILSLGRDLYLIEAKCTLFPVDLSDEANLIKKFEEADAQLTRKVEFVRSRIQKVRDLHSCLQGIRVAPTSVSGIIVTNFPGGQMPWSNHFATDTDSLAAYFGMGVLLLKGTHYGLGVALDERFIVRYYDSYSSFRQNFVIYLRTAPQGCPFVRFLRKSVAVFPLSRWGSYDFEVTMPEVVLPADNSEFDRALLEIAILLRKQFGVPL